MDTSLSASQVARELATSVPRVVRAAHKLGLAAEHGRGYAFTPAMVAALRAALGVNPPVDGLSAEEARVLKALSSAPFGVASARSVARRAHVSPTTAARAVRSLEAKKLVCLKERMIARGRVTRTTVIHADRNGDAWRAIRGELRDVVLPDSPAPPARTVPRELRHLFWNTADEQLTVADNGGYLARRLLERNDYNALAWGARDLSSSDWSHAAAARGIDPARRAMAENLARGA